MQIPTHIATGYIISVLINNSYLTDINASLITKVAIVGSLAPDVDGLFGKQIKDHRKTIFHAPLFWALCLFLFFLTTYLIGYKQLIIYGLVFYLGTFFHLFLDWFSGRTAGIRILYPFSKKQYSLFPLNPEIGDVSVIPNKKNIKKYLKFVRYCFKNKFLVFTQLIILLIAIIIRIK